MSGLNRRTSTTVVPAVEPSNKFDHDEPRNVKWGLKWRAVDDQGSSDKAYYHRLDSSAGRSRRIPSARYPLRACAILGWPIAIVLFVTLLATNASEESRHSSVMSVRNLTTPYLGSVVENFGAKAGLHTAPARTSPDSSSPVKATSSKNVAPHPNQNRVTIVSGFYRIDSGKKHRVSEYHTWLSNFLGQVELPIVFYCAPELRTLITGLRGSKPITIIDTYETPFSMPPLQALGGREWAVLQNAIDPESNWHVPDVYGVWTAKPWMVQNVKDRNIYQSDYFFWVDAGGFRDASVEHTFLGLEAELDRIYDSVPDDTLILSSTEQPFEKGLDYVLAARPGGELDRSDRLQGGWYGGKASGIDWWARETMKVTVRQSALQKFTAKEQPVWNQAARLNWPKVYVQNMAERQGTDCGPDVWFGFEYFADGRDCHVPAWNGPKHKALFGAQASR